MAEQPLKLTRTAAIKRFFEDDGGRKVTVDELKKLSPEDRQELGTMCAQALGAEIVETAAA